MFQKHSVQGEPFGRGGGGGEVPGRGGGGEVPWRGVGGDVSRRGTLGQLAAEETGEGDRGREVNLGKGGQVRTQ